MTQNNQLNKKVIVVFGATGEIGKPLVKTFRQNRASLTLVARTKANLEALELELGRSDELVTIPTDITNPDEVRSVLEKTKEHFGGIDAVVISTGSWEETHVDDSLERVLEFADKHYQIFFKGVLIVEHLAQQFFRKQFEENGRVGTIAHISSHAGMKPELPGNLTYGSMKAGARLLTISLGIALKGKGVVTTDIAPAIVNTPKETRLNTPEKKALAVQPEDIAKVIMEIITNPNRAQHPLLDCPVIL